jgi:2-C-methyl-D-erythritol 4-phosphate cytidylyltransferase
MTQRGQPRLFALVPCAGTGERAGAGRPKQYVALAGRSVVAHTLDALVRVGRLSGLLVVLAPEDISFEQAVPGFVAPARWVARCGGATRAETVAAGLAVLRTHGAGDDDWVLVHDAARCLLQPQWVDRLIDACLDDPVGGLLALPLADTLKQAQGQRVQATVARTDKWAAQTPQMFRIGLLERALRGSAGVVTDESGAIEALGLSPRLVTGELENLKVTYPADFALAERLLASRVHGTAGQRVAEDEHPAGRAAS